MSLFKEKSLCSGCQACLAVCKKGAIKMQPDSLGFLYPQINDAICVKCGQCESVCPYNKKPVSFFPQVIYAARHKRIKELTDSRSGAVFVAITDWILSKGGVVYGAAFDRSLTVCHMRAEDKSGRDSFRGSKYVQSDIKHAYDNIKKDLISGRYVLFSGTPCQIAGIKNYIPTKLIERLYLVDIICHGVPSPELFSGYLTYLKNKYHSEVTTFNFRDKTNKGWHDHVESFTLKDGRHIESNDYTRLFYTNCFFREACYFCPYANYERVGDITLGDFWGWEKVDCNFNSDDRGCSLVFLNTKKGEDVLDQCREDLDLRLSTKENCVQPNLRHPTSIPTYRDRVKYDFEKKGIGFVIKKYSHEATMWAIIKKIVKRYLL